MKKTASLIEVKFPIAMLFGAPGISHPPVDVGAMQSDRFDETARRLRIRSYENHPQFSEPPHPSSFEPVDLSSSTYHQLLEHLEADPSFHRPPSAAITATSKIRDAAMSKIDAMPQLYQAPGDWLRVGEREPIQVSGVLLGPLQDRGIFVDGDSDVQFWTCLWPALLLKEKKKLPKFVCVGFRSSCETLVEKCLDELPADSLRWFAARGELQKFSEFLKKSKT